MSEQGQIGGAGKNEPSWLALFINIILQRDEQFRAALDFVEDRGVFQQRFTIAPRCRQRGEVVERPIGPLIITILSSPSSRLGSFRRVNFAQSSSPLQNAPCSSTSLRVESFSWMAASLGGENPQPIFRVPSPDVPVEARAGLPPEVAGTIGKGCGRRVLPYCLQDRYNRKRAPREFVSVVLENENLKATFLPALGGRLISLVHKPTGRELLYRNPVFQPANLALRDAWFAGGIEWNVGQYGHAFHTCAPVYAAEIPGIGGSMGLRLYDFDRCKGLLWQIDFHLPPGAHFLLAFTRVVNPQPEEVGMYWWTNVAVRETPGLRVLAPASESVYVDYGSEALNLAYGQARLPSLPTIGGRDGTYPENLSFTNEFFFQCQAAKLPWEAALDEHGRGFVEASTQPLNVRKVFCWGMHRGGRRWQDFLCADGQRYLEVQAGLAPTQQHLLPMPAGAQWSWTQAFGYVEADPAKVHVSDWTAACQAVEQSLSRNLNAAQLAEVQEVCSVLADTAPTKLLVPGTGWGALEAKRRAVQGASPFPAAFAFPDSTLNDGQRHWLALLETGRFPEQAPAQAPGEWMIQTEWRTLLEKSIEVPANRHWLALLHLGVMMVEAFDDAGAVAAWEESIRLRPSAWAWRNLGALAVRRGAPEEALAHYQQAWALASVSGVPDISFAIEFLSALHAAKQYPEAWDFFRLLPAAMQEEGVVRLLAAKVAFELDDLAFVERALAGEFSSIREGARDLTELWFGLQAKRVALATGRPLDAALLREVRQSCEPPEAIDFRVVE